VVDIEDVGKERMLWLLLLLLLLLLLIEKRRVEGWREDECG
jgi:hypothetical protein